MAKARQIAVVDRASDPQEWAVAVLRMRFDEVIGMREAALKSEDIHGVHDMRVATRRLRGALRDLAQVIDEHSLRRVKKDLKRLADVLGAVRDQDVAILALEKLRLEAESSPIAEGIGKLTEEHRELRQRSHARLTKSLAVTSIEGLRERFSAAIDTALGQRDLFQPISLREAGHDVIAAHLQDLSDTGISIYEPFNDKALHKLRISAKHLRYAIELFAVCWGAAVYPFAEEVANMQSRLGEVHDCDVWIGYLSKRLKHKGRTKSDGGFSFEAAAWLLSEFVRKRSREYRSALELWSEWKANDFTERLRAVISKT